MPSKASLIVVILAVLVIGASLYGYIEVQKGDPKIQVTPKSYDFGNIPKESVNYTFMVKNIGKGTLKIKGVTTSCGCTKASIDSETIKPGQSTNLLVTFDPNSMNITGPVYRIVYIKSNDLEQLEVEVEITANVIG
ncbi:MAG TPA: DUF1573 domain-containing protein [Methanosarcinales archaeon]|nr:DUF1573 domain-containing protein [Methanosarcinales archaeon]